MRYCIQKNAKSELAKFLNISHGVVVRYRIHCYNFDTGSPHQPSSQGLNKLAASVAGGNAMLSPMMLVSIEVK